MNYVFAIDEKQRIFKLRPDPLFYMHPFKGYSNIPFTINLSANTSCNVEPDEVH